MTRAAALLIACSLALVGTGCGGDDAADDTGTDRTTTTAPAADPGDDGATTVPDGQVGVPDGPVVALVDSSLGGILADGDGNTLYMFDDDTPVASACSGECAATWPPFEGPASADGVDASKLGTITRDDGVLQVTFGGHPLYRYSGDGGPAGTAGQGVGGVWWVLNAEGDSIRGEGDAGGGTPNPYG